VSDSDHWPQLVFEVTADMVPALEDTLFSAGALSVILVDSSDQPVLEPEPGEIRLWDSLRVTGLFQQSESPDAILERCYACSEQPLPQYRFENLPDEDWVRSWMANFKAMKFGEHLWICPSHQQVSVEDALVIELDPGLAFGSGTHPTTALCLAWLDGLHSGSAAQLRTVLAGQTVIDYGCGSGVLAIACALLGASRVIAIDIDEQALSSTRDNAQRNGVSDLIETHLPPLDPACADELRADLLIANILCNPILGLRQEFAELLREGGDLVLSGLLQEQVETVMLHYTQCFNSQTTRSQDGWALVAARRDTAGDRLLERNR